MGSYDCSVIKDHAFKYIMNKAGALTARQVHKIRSMPATPNASFGAKATYHVKI